MDNIYPFLSNKYSRWYDAVVESARVRNRPNEYVERHHIIPKCLGGEKGEVVALTAREHYVCHLLLTKMVDTPDAIKRMKFALSSMIRQKERKLTSRQYAICRKAAADARRGEKWSDERRRRKSEQMKILQLGEKNNFYGKKHTEEMKRRMSITKTGIKMSDEYKKKLSNMRRGVPQPRLYKHCPFCDGWYHPGVRTRLHLFKCKKHWY